MRYRNDYHRARLLLPRGLTGKGTTIAFMECAVPDPDIDSNKERSTWFVDTSEEKWTTTDFSKHIGFRPHAHTVCSIGAGAGKLTGVAPSANILQIKTVPRSKILPAMPHDEMAYALRRVIELQHRYQVRILVLTFGPWCGDGMGPWEACPFSREVENAASHGILVISAVGNCPHLFPFPPANAPSVLSVGGVTGGRKGKRSWELFSHNWGVTLEGRKLPNLLAPCDVPEPYSGLRVNGIFRYVLYEGTCYAAGFVAGVAALCLEANPNLSPQELKLVLCNSCTKLSHLPSEKQGFGLINPLAAAESALARRSYRKLPEGVNTPSTTHLLQCLRSRNKVTRNAAMKYLWSLQHISRVLARSLLPFLHSKEPKVVCSVLSILGELGNFRQEIYKANFMRHHSFRVRIAWGKALVGPNDALSCDVVCEMLRDEHQDVRWMGTRLSQSISSIVLLPYLVAAMRECENNFIFIEAKDSAERIAGVNFDWKRGRRWTPAHKRCVYERWTKWLLRRGLEIKGKRKNANNNVERTL